MKNAIKVYCSGLIVSHFVDGLKKTANLNGTL